MKKIFDSAYGKDLAAFLVVLGISLELHSWDILNLVFLVGPLVAFIPRVAFIYYSQKSPKEGEKAMMVGMAVGYLFLAVGFAGEPSDGLMKDAVTTLFTAAFYYGIAWSLTSYGFAREKKEIVKPTKLTLIFMGALITYLIYEMFFATDMPSHHGIYRYALVVIAVVGMARQIILYFRPKYHIE
jgi:hypothetical protein